MSEVVIVLLNSTQLSDVVPSIRHLDTVTSHHVITALRIVAYLNRDNSTSHKFQIFSKNSLEVPHLFTALFLLATASVVPKVSQEEKVLDLTRDSESVVVPSNFPCLHCLILCNFRLYLTGTYESRKAKES